MKKTNSFSVLLSLSLPPDLTGSQRAQDLYDFLVAIVSGVIGSGGRIVFGGHPTITPLIHRIVTTKGVAQPCISLYQLERFQKSAPTEIRDEHIFNLTWIESMDSKVADPLNRELDKMRTAMAKEADAGIFLGGNPQSLSSVPGILDEYQHFIQCHPQGPAYLLGFLGGPTTDIINNQNNPEPNFLDERELDIIHHSMNIDLIASLILADIVKWAARSLHP